MKWDAKMHFLIATFVACEQTPRRRKRVWALGNLKVRAHEELKSTEADDHAGEQQLPEQYGAEDTLHVAHVTHEPQVPLDALSQFLQHHCVRSGRAVFSSLVRRLDASLGDDLHFVAQNPQLRGHTDVERADEVVETEDADTCVYRRERL